MYAYILLLKICLKMRVVLRLATVCMHVRCFMLFFCSLHSRILSIIENTTTTRNLFLKVTQALKFGTINCSKLCGVKVAELITFNAIPNYLSYPLAINSNTFILQYYVSVQNCCRHYCNCALLCTIT